ncbi:dihydrolipoyl dehydrogenase [Rhodocaloribacter litoris]|uniref:dihydrolipoyl dehydrogenase n=1 Tax=Rhodocaloribacter litoris TaxID=2558931 RepID=UPI00142349FD|nr:dihydrolipoyl dehydrogenase [Rhodocaloribacter litoris]QXD14968.1 dihydrolipoyl dehydrogenase [Rhodocaloribacter litoris]
MATSQYDVVVIGTGPGGYETAIRASQLGFKTAVIEKNKLGGVCLNIGCIPTKALLKSAELMEYGKHLEAYGLAGQVKPDFPKVIARSRAVADKMNKGVDFLMKKNKIDVLYGYGRLTGKGKIDVQPSENMDGEKIGEARTVEAKHIILATGARAREIPPLPVDGKKIITYKEAMLQTTQPKRLVVVGAGAIGVEFAYFYHHMGTEVTLIEVMDRIVPVEDADVSKELARQFKKAGINVMTSAEVLGVDTKGKTLKVKVKTKKGEEVIECDQVLSAVGVVGNIENLGLETVGVKTERGAIVVDGFGRTNVPGIYAIGDVAGPPWLAHKASHEGILCVEKIAGLDVHPLDKKNIPGCTYCQPQIASVGYTEQAAKEAGYEVKVGKFPFTASGKASALGHTEGFVKVIYDAKYGEFLGCHIIGYDATELIAEAVTARVLETTAHEIMEAIHPHPTLSEAVMEATRAAYGMPINI